MKRMSDCFNPFLVRASVYCISRPPRNLPRLALAFQSLLSQGISLLHAVAVWEGEAIVATFQSLLSQGISLLTGRALSGAFWTCRSFNPFLVRASVY